MKKILIIVPWLLMVLALGAAGAVYVLVAKPAQLAVVAEREAKEKALADAEGAKNHVEHSLHEAEKRLEDVRGHHKKNEEASHELQTSKDEIELALEEPIRRGVAQVARTSQSLVIALESTLLFTTGTSEIHAKGKELLRKASQALLRHPNARLQVVGHMDNQAMPVNLRGVFFSNWERGFGEAVSVVHFLEEEVHVPGSYLSAASHSQFQPVESNKAAEGRKKNHRIELHLRWELPEHKQETASNEHH